MQKNRVFNAESKSKFFNDVLQRMFTLRVFADEGEAPKSGESTQSAGINYEQLISQARKEEKDKLYPRIKKLEEENKALTSSVNKYLIEIGTLKEEIEKLKSSPKEESSKIKELESKIKALEEENKSLKESTPDEEKIREQIKAEYEVKLYAKEQLDKYKDEILSVFASEITGSTKEEVDKAIEEAKKKTMKIKEDLGLLKDDKDEEDKSEKDKTKKSKKAKRVPPANPSDEEEDKFNIEYVRNLDPRSEEYKQFRKKLGLK